MNEIIYLNLITSGDKLAKFSRYSDLAAGWKTEIKFQFPAEARFFFLLPKVLGPL